MEETKKASPKRVLARVLADELGSVQGGMNAQQTYGSSPDSQWPYNTDRFTDVDSQGDADTDSL